jgi:hypothetical protein
MLVQATVMYLGHEENSFKGKNDEMVNYKKANFLAVGEMSPICLSVAKECDISARPQLSKCRITINLYADKAGYLKGRVEDVVWDEDNRTSTGKQHSA